MLNKAKEEVVNKVIKVADDMKGYWGKSSRYMASISFHANTVFNLQNDIEQNYLCTYTFWNRP